MKFTIHRLIFTTTLFLVSLFAFSQGITIKGKITDAVLKEGLPACNVYVNNSTIGTGADLDGNFIMTVTSFKEFDLVFSYIGYESFTKRIIAKDGDEILLDVALKPLDFQLSEIEVKSKRDKKWEKQLKKFSKQFFGYSYFADKCEIVNAWVLDFEEEKNTFKAIANQPLQIKNNTLGYNLEVNLQDFLVENDAYKIKGTFRFSEQEPPTKEQLEEWLKRRAEAYKRSYVSLFKSILDGKLDENGYQLYAEKPGQNINEFRSDNFDVELGKSVIPYLTKDMVKLTTDPNLKRIMIAGNLEIHNQNAQTELKTYADTPYAVSWLTAAKGMVQVDLQGVPTNSQDILVSGDMDYLKVAGMLPIDYDPKSNANDAYFLKFEKPAMVEKVVLHTDRSAYYGGDNIWYKTYVNYNFRNYADSSSKILHVMLVDQNKSVIKSQKLEISNGFAYGNMVLPEDLVPGNYYLKAYTNYMQNFDPKFSFEQLIPVLAHKEYFAASQTSVEEEQEMEKAVQVNITKSDSLGGKISALAFSFKNQAGVPVMSNFSVSITNPTYDPQLNTEPKMEDLYKIPSPESLGISKKTFGMEKGINVEGIYLDKKRTPFKGSFNVFVNGFQNFVEGVSDESGNFKLENLMFYGESVLWLQPSSKKQKDNIFIVKNDQNKPEIKLLTNSIDINKTKLDTLVFQKIKDLSKNTKDSTFKKENLKKMLYGRPDYTVANKELNANNGLTGIVNSILKKVPSMQYSQGDFIIRGGATSAFNSNAALILVDGIPGASWSSLNPNAIEKIEVVAGVNNMYGDLSRNGIVSFFTKDEISSDGIPDIEGSTKVLVDGLVNPLPFESPKIQMTQPENKPTLYWNAEVLTDQKGTARVMYRSDYPKQKIKVTVNGITQNNVPFSKTFYLE